MINVIKNGKEKTYQARCRRCGTDFTYQYEDILEVKRDGDYIFPELVVKCPVCEGDIFAILIPTDEYDKNVFPSNLYSCCSFK